MKIAHLYFPHVGFPIHILAFPLLLMAGACWLGGHFAESPLAKRCAIGFLVAALICIAVMEQ
jgi:hypothetical protein